ncbi:MAG: hypothetical protein LBE61_21240 [Burkholderiaceae bacterium]|jgi:hypothetical protein|nr:hypothetical protein [Burkholderiaceae bacterium]
MSTASHSIAENWIRDYLEPRYPELVAPYREAGRITANALQSGHLEEAELQVLLGHVASSKSVLSNNVGDMLGKLAQVFPSALQALEHMAQSNKVGLRVQALSAMRHLPPSPLHERMYATAMADRNKKVRMLAAQNAQSQAMAVLLPALEQAIAREEDADTRHHLLRCRNLLRDGHVQETDAAGNVWITCCFKSGTTSRMFTRTRFETDGTAWIAKNAAEWRANWYGQP